MKQSFTKPTHYWGPVLHEIAVCAAVGNVDNAGCRQQPEPLIGWC